MAGKRIGGLKAAAKNLAKDPDFYKRIGAMGGSAAHKTPRGFANMTAEKRRAAGAKGGKVSRREPQWYYDNLKLEQAMAETEEWIKEEELAAGLDAIKNSLAIPLEK